MTLLEIAQKGYFCETICCPKLVKIAQSGHTDFNIKAPTSKTLIVTACFSGTETTIEKKVAKHIFGKKRFLSLLRQRLMT